MLEWLAAATGVELGKLVLEQVLNLGKSALEDYVKDFFKDCIKSGVALAHVEALKKPMAEAVGCFIKRFIKELQINAVLDTSIEHHYKAAIKRFVQDKAVRPILGKAFEKDCKQIDYAELQRIWTQQYQVDGWEFPAEEFDWRGVAKEYVYEVKGIIKANAELRSLLDTELLEDIARNTAQLSPGFDVAKYRESLQCSYGYLKLYTLDSTDRADTIKLWNMFIEQTVREALPPTRYELPLDLKRQLQEQGQLDDLSPEALEHYRSEYFQQPARKVLEAVAEAQHAVILGDPGAGKSTLLQYLALDWVEGKTVTLPLLIELREYVLAQSANFLDFLHRGRGADWQFDQQQLYQHLLENSTLVMFDGLDEVFDRPTQASVIDDIIRFAQQYPQAKILVTSRIVGYNPDRFQHAGFRQFTIQPLDETEIHEFIDRWYDLAMGNDFDKARLKQRLKDAIENSKAIGNLADNPLLLTMMAILNRRQELPRDRADLYDQASRVLLYHWDVDHKRLQLPMDAIGRREKQDMLRLIAYEMQVGEEGLKGNLIGVDRLTRILTDYLRDQGFSEPREKANQLIQQLRERNFILCYRGADTYGFVHRTFLEYFCALEIVNRFEKQRSISFEQLRDEIFGQHWQDETWHEVLQLISIMIDLDFAYEIIDYLIGQDGTKNDFINWFLSASCIVELGDRSKAVALCKKMLNLPLETAGFAWGHSDDFPNSLNIFFRSYASKALSIAIDILGDSPDSETFSLIETRVRTCIKFAKGDVPAIILQKLTEKWKENPKLLPLLKFAALSGEPYLTRLSALHELAEGWKSDPDTLHLLRTCAESDKNFFVRWVAIYELARGWKEEPGIFEFLCNQAINDPFIRDERASKSRFPNPRKLAFQAITEFYADYDQTIEILMNQAEQDMDWLVRSFLLRVLGEKWKDTFEVVELLYNRAIQDSFERKDDWEVNPRQIALEAILENYADCPRTQELLQDRAINDSDEQLREWAQQQLEKLEQT